jgi:hypothetical protein
MLIDMEITIAYKCFSCGTFDFTGINLFKLQHKKQVYKCVCRESELTIKELDKNQYLLSVPCIGCGLKHSYIIKREDILFKDVSIYLCPVTGLKHCFIGRDNLVRDYIDMYEIEMDIMINSLGYDSYFANNQVMIDTLNKIHDIASNGLLYCECGCGKISVNMLRKGIYLKCSQCSGGKLIPAATNGDLKNILETPRIIIGKRKSKSVFY